LNAVIYARYSSDNQREESIEGQLRECSEFAERKGYTVIKTYADRAISGKKADNRPEFMQMIADSKQKLFDAVIVWKIDRFSRDKYDSVYYKNVLKKNGVSVISATEPIDDSPEGQLMESIFEGFSVYYIKDLSAKVSRGMTENALKCKYNGGARTFGYIIDEDKHFQPDPVNALIS
jgi:site-specific DNA recombinase